MHSKDPDEIFYRLRKSPHKRPQNEGAPETKRFNSTRPGLFEKLSTPPLVGAVNALTAVSVLIAVVAFLIDRGDRHEDRVFNAWGLVNESGPGNTGRAAALEFLNTQDCWFGAAGPFSDWVYNALHWDRPSRCLIRAFDGELQIDHAGFSLEGEGGARSQILLAGIDLSAEEGKPVTYLRTARLVSSFLENANLSRTDLSYAKLDGSYLMHTNFTKAELNYASLQSLIAPSSNFECADAFEVDFSRSTISDANMRRMFAPGAKFRDSQIANSDLSESDLSGADFSESVLLNVDASGAQLDGATFLNTGFGGVNFSGADLSFVTIVGSEEDRFRFDRADLSGFALMGNVSEENTSFDGAYYCEGTRTPSFPSGWQGPSIESRKCSIRLGRNDARHLCGRPDPTDFTDYLVK